MTDSELWTIWDALEWEQPLDAREIEERAGFTPQRTCERVRAGVRRLRELGLPVCSNSDGFWKTNLASDLAGCIQNLQQRAAGNQHAADSLLARIMEGPLSRAAYEENARRLLKNP